MIALLIDVSSPRDVVVLLACLALGVLAAQRFQLWVADRSDVADQRRQERENEAIRLGNSHSVPSIPAQRDRRGGAR